MFWLLAQQVEKAADTGQVVESASGWLIFWLILGVVFLPYIIGSGLANLLKLKAFSNRFGTVLFCLSIAIVPTVYQITVNDKPFNECFRLGIDLQGGTNLVYQVDLESATPTSSDEGVAPEDGIEEDESVKDLDRSLDNMVGAIARRVNPSGTEEVTVRRVGQRRIEIIIPGADQAYTDEMKARITRLGSLQFEILATESNDVHKPLVRKARGLKDNELKIVQDGRTRALWVDVVEGEQISIGGGELLPGEVRDVKRGDKTVQQALVVLTQDSRRVTGDFLTRATEQMNQANGQLVVGFRFDRFGADRFKELTSTYQPLRDGRKYRLAVLLDGKIQTAPSLNDVISDQGQISGNFTRTEVRSLVDVLNAGALDVPLDETPVSEFTISPLLGADIKAKGINAIAISAVVVILFMAVYYLKAGLIAVLSLCVNIVLIMGMMIFVQGTFTLPGLAGLVLTIGMAVDANVLIFERIREEMNRGASVRMAIHNGFDKAFSAIIDSNLTTLIVAIILFMIGTDQVKGFAVTLFIGIVMSMFSTLYFGRLVFEVLDQKRLLRTLGMFAIVKSPALDFVGKRKIALVCSGALILAGMGTFVSRGEENLDIDFRGGTMVTFQFEQPHTLDDFRDTLEKTFGTGITVERLTLPDESQQADEGRRWRLRTVNDNVAEVQSGVADALGSLDLRRVTVAVGDLQDIAAAAGKGSDGEETEAVENDETDETQSAYEGGWKAELAFRNGADPEELSLTTVTDKLNRAIKAVNEDSYPEPDALYRATGTEGSGVDAKEGQVLTFSSVLIEARPDGMTKDDLQSALANLESDMAATPLFEEVTSFLKSVGGEMQQQAVLAMLLSLAAIVIYIWFRFQRLTFGFAAVVAIVHDVLVVLGIVALASTVSGTGVGSLLALYDFKINLPMIAAFLTIVGYSLNDTIVIFDRIREVRGKNPALTSEMINTSLNQTLSRTLLTSLTTFFVVMILYAFGGEGIHGFAFCLLIGVVVGTYSSIYVASPVLLWLMNRGAKTSPATV